MSGISVHRYEVTGLSVAGFIGRWEGYCCWKQIDIPRLASRSYTGSLTYSSLGFPGCSRHLPTHVLSMERICQRDIIEGQLWGVWGVCSRTSSTREASEAWLSPDLQPPSHIQNITLHIPTMILPSCSCLSHIIFGFYDPHMPFTKNTSITLQRMSAVRIKYHMTWCILYVWQIHLSYICKSVTRPSIRYQPCYRNSLILIIILVQMAVITTV